MKLKRNILLTVLLLAILSGCQVNRNQNESQTDIPDSEQYKTQNNNQTDNTGEQQDDEQSQNLTESKIEEKLGYVFAFDKDSKSFEFELVEWITTDDAKRINELGLNPDNDMPSGFYIHSLGSVRQSYVVSDETEYQIIDWEQNGELTVTDADGFANHINGLYESKSLCWITIDNGSVISITERYVP